MQLIINDFIVDLDGRLSGFVTGNVRFRAKGQGYYGLGKRDCVWLQTGMGGMGFI
jgi:hypothetical protein